MYKLATLSIRTFTAVHAVGDAVGVDAQRGRVVGDHAAFEEGRSAVGAGSADGCCEQCGATLLVIPSVGALVVSSGSSCGALASAAPSALDDRWAAAGVCVAADAWADLHRGHVCVSAVGIVG